MYFLFIYLYKLLRKYRKLSCLGKQLFLLTFHRWDVSRWGTSTTQRQKFHIDDVNQCLHNISGSHGVPHAHLLNYTFLLVDFSKVLCSSSNELQQNSNASAREEIYSTSFDCFLRDSLRIWPSWPFVFCLSFVNNRWNSVTTLSTKQHFWLDSGQILHRQYRISVNESQTLFLTKWPQRWRVGRNGCFHRLEA